MQVVTVETSAGQTRYYLANDDGTPVEPVLQYLRLSKPFSFSSVYFKAILPPPGIQVVLLYQNPAGFANHTVSSIRHNAHDPGFAYAFFLTAFFAVFSYEANLCSIH